MNWSLFCHAHCLKFTFPSGPRKCHPPLYWPFSPGQEIPSNNIALSLPPHSPYDCTIDLLPGAMLSTHTKLVWVEREAMEKCIKESLAAGTICHSTSPVGTEFLTGNGSLVLLTSDYKKMPGVSHLWDCSTKALLSRPLFEGSNQKDCRNTFTYMYQKI